MRCMKFIQNYHNEHTKIEFGMLIVVILYEFHTSHFAVYICMLIWMPSHSKPVLLSALYRQAIEIELCFGKLGM